MVIIGPQPGVEPAAAQLEGTELLEEVDRLKTTANDLFKRDLFDPALQAYLSAIWLLKPSPRPMYHEALNGQLPPLGADAAPFLGGWRGGASAHGSGAAAVSSPQDEADDEAEGASPDPAPDSADDATREAGLRMALHLNVAACALKRGDHELAREACAQLVDAHGEQPKALYRAAPSALVPHRAPSSRCAADSVDHVWHRRSIAWRRPSTGRATRAAPSQLSGGC